eukprot:104472-Prorocentrum_minimum.AAC.2
MSVLSRSSHWALAGRWRTPSARPRLCSCRYSRADVQTSRLRTRVAPKVFSTAVTVTVTVIALTALYCVSGGARAGEKGERPFGPFSFSSIVGIDADIYGARKESNFRVIRWLDKVLTVVSTV